MALYQLHLLAPLPTTRLNLSAQSQESPHAALALALAPGQLHATLPNSHPEAKKEKKQGIKNQKVGPSSPPLPNKNNPNPRKVHSAARTPTNSSECAKTLQSAVMDGSAHSPKAWPARPAWSAGWWVILSLGVLGRRRCVGLGVGFAVVRVGCGGLGSRVCGLRRDTGVIWTGDWVMV